MQNRREFLRTGAVMSALAIHGLRTPSAAALGAAPATASLHKAIYDGRYEEARSFAATAAAAGVAVRSLDDGDVTRFWYDELEPLWRRELVAIAGLTQFGPMFVVGRLAAEHRMRVAFRVEHRLGAEGGLVHVVEGPSATLARAGELGAAGLEWPETMAVLACEASGDASPAAVATLSTPGARPTLSSAASAEMPSVIHYYAPHRMQQGYGPALDGPLYSWVVAPRARGSRG